LLEYSLSSRPKCDTSGVSLTLTPGAMRKIGVSTAQGSLIKAQAESREPYTPEPTTPLLPLTPAAEATPTAPADTAEEEEEESACTVVTLLAAAAASGGTGSEVKKEQTSM
jgi:hypothetical protein